MTECESRSICIIGPDGAGKTTIGKAIADEMRHNGKPYLYWWCGWREFRSFPFRFVRWILQFLNTENSNSRKTTEENPALEEPSFLQQVIGLIYFPFVFIDHYISTAPKAISLSLRGEPVIYDRYYYGMIVGFCSFYSYSDRLIRILLSLSILYPTPDVLVYLDIDPETAYERKDDVPSSTYIEKRCVRYEVVLDRAEVVTIDARQPIEAVKQDTFDALRVFDE